MADSAQVSTAGGKWSVALALGSAVVLWPVGLIVAIALMPIGSMTDPDYRAALGVAAIVAHVLIVAMLIAAVIFGVTSIVRARRQSERPGRTTGIVLGWIGIGLSALMGWVLLTPYI
jgi:hypothetical protein